MPKRGCKVCEKAKAAVSKMCSKNLYVRCDTVRFRYSGVCKGSEVAVLQSVDFQCDYSIEISKFILKSSVKDTFLGGRRKVAVSKINNLSQETHRTRGKLVWGKKKKVECVGKKNWFGRFIVVIQI